MVSRPASGLASVWAGTVLVRSPGGYCSPEGAALITVPPLDLDDLVHQKFVVRRCGLGTHFCSVGSGLLLLSVGQVHQQRLQDLQVEQTACSIRWMGPESFMAYSLSNGDTFLVLTLGSPIFW